MDLDGLIPLIICIFISLFLATGLGVLIGNYREAQRRTILGFSNAAAGIGVLCIIPLGLAFYFARQLLTTMPLSGLWLLAFSVFVSVLFVLFIALGLFKSKESTDSFFVKTLSGTGIAVGSIVTAPAKLLFRAFQLDASEDVTEEDVLNLVDSLVENEDEGQTVDENQKDMISAVFELDDISASDMMTHRTDVIAVEENTPAGEVAKLAHSEGISRLPVFKGRLDTVTGIVYIKDLLSLFGDTENSGNPIKEFMRPAMFVPESCRARDLLLEFKTKHTQIAVVVDEYGGTSGIVTMEDVLEEIVGNIQDEFDHEEEQLLECENGFICDGSIDLEDVFDAFDIEIPEYTEDEDFDSISGLITQKLGRIPAENENATIEWGGLIFNVISSDHKRILKVQVFKKQNPSE